MNASTFKIKGEYIDLIQLLKATGIAENGANAQLMVIEGRVKLNGEKESRKRAKLYPGDRVEIFGNKITLE